ncbi:MAG TPA: ABC transporter substrate-binding protein [Bradyrhizobium sp.]|jgi:putative ABC transport system substrate-binding protein|nr:ABC transporter substrate-binding protein [Bradyrhizobium sp.]
MKRRKFLSLFAGVTASLSRTAPAQQRDRRKVVAMVSAFSEQEMEPLRTALIGKLRELGWREGENLEFDLRLTGGDPSAMADAAAALVQRRPDIIVAQGSPLLEAVRRHSGGIPVVFMLVADPVGLGLIQSLSHPGGELTGFTNFELSVGSKWVELLSQASPAVSTLVLIANPGNPTSTAFSRLIEASARSVKLEARTVYVRNAAEIEQAIRSAGGPQHAALMTLPDFLPVINRDLIVKLTNELRMPSIHPFRTFPVNGALMSYGLDFPELYRQAAVYVDRILRGTKPADLPVQAPNKFELVINLITAKALGVDVPAALLASADELIE